MARSSEDTDMPPGCSEGHRHICASQRGDVCLRGHSGISPHVAGQIMVCAYGLTALHSWTQRTLRMTNSLMEEWSFYMRLMQKFTGGVAKVSDEAAKRVHERRSTSLQEIASLWSLALPCITQVVQAIGATPPMVHSVAFYATVSLGSTVMRRFAATLGMPRELMPACYMARTLCFTFTNSQFSNKVNIVLAPFYVLSHWFNLEPDAPSERLLFSMAGEVVAVALSILVVTNLDTKEPSPVCGAAQRLLSVTCDAFVRLSHDLKIRTPSSGLLDLLMCHFGSNSTSKLDGVPFLRYIAQADHQRFTEFRGEVTHIPLEEYGKPTLSLHTIDDVADMKHMLGRFQNYSSIGPVQSSRHSKSSRSSRSSSQSSRSSRKADLKKLNSLQKLNLLIDQDFMIRSVTLTFTAPGQFIGDDEVLPNLMEWVKPNYREKVSHWIQEHANAHYANRDNALSVTEVLSYHVPPPVPIMLGAFKLFSTAIWVPPLFGFAGFLIGSLYWWIDDFLEIPEAKRCPSLLQTFAAVTLFAGNYAASGFLSSNHLGVGRSQQDLVPKDWLNNALPKSCWRALPSTE
eukprot:g16087.t1